MIVEEIRNIKSGRRELRKFGLTIGIVLVLLGGGVWWRGKDYHYYFLGAATAFILIGATAPFVLKPVHRFWMTLAVLMSWFMTMVILGVVFYLGLTSIGFLAKLFGKDFLGLKFDKDITHSYWMPKEKAKDKNNYEKQF